MSADRAPLWDTEAFSGVYAGHPGRLYRRGPATIDDLIAGTRCWTDREFLVHGERRITYAQFRGALGRVGERLRDLGVQPRDRVMVFGYNSPEWIAAVFGLWLRGAVPVLGNRWWSTTEVTHAADLLDLRHILTDTPLQTASASSPLSELAGAFDSPGPEASGTDSEIDTDIDDVALILFTSGSSGLPKAVELSRRSVIANQQNILVRNGRLPHLLDADSPQVVSLASTPMFHIGGLSSLLTHFLTGGRIVLAEGRFDAGQVMALIERERVQVWGAVPTMAVRVLEHPEFGSRDLTSLRSWPLGGAPVSPELLERIRTTLPNLRERGLSNTWGMTEAGGFLTVADSRDLRARPGTVGRPYPVVELQIDRPDADGVGEVLARSPAVMLGYAGRGADETVDADGWLHTGDLGHLDDDGYLYIDGRSKDIVIRGGENIACPHVEAALTSHPAVVEAAALGLPHPDLGEELAAVVVYRDGARPPTDDELRRHLAGVVSSFAVPTRWRIRTEPLPTLAGEKVDKRALAAELR
ncbi:class I adenylate-forming enzyme family protein [Mycolicibacterium litorale]|uniref:Fatty acid--CoA ligase n=1 Tax=Mycolicibacterium litorale TaxID=758802 RepID=A0AAD1IG01_9MYCO|nr:class I adenylate-forming enzyme family protein [Mycolicibacterium litorale]MCV7414654.1 acyl--CoA ligase [Mycolicibacterium litorale]TDY00850.1 acyl-CoA synthetase (AMP-forming)/AMP-acid ligase II [Mycolicibacterium litorale]BBY14747.1 fatty acid--CoA ligase [Mycolicibacterium litorale]